MITSEWNPPRRYTCVVVFDQKMERVLLVEKLKPVAQKGKVNFPGGALEEKDFEGFDGDSGTQGALAFGYATCAARELFEETGLVVRQLKLIPFCELRCPRETAGAAEVRFFVTVADIDSAFSQEAEKVFTARIDTIMRLGIADSLFSEGAIEPSYRLVMTMKNLPWLVSMALVALRSESFQPHVVYDLGNG